LDVKDKGSVVVSTTSCTKIILDVLYIPVISQNLLSVTDACEQFTTVQRLQVHHFLCLWCRIILCQNGQ